MSGFYSYDAWKTTPPPGEDRDDEAEQEQRDAEHEQEMYEQGAIDADERAPWPGDARDDAMDPASAAGRSGR